MPDEFIRSILPRYGRAPRNLLRNPSISDRAVRLYALLDDYADADGKAFPKRALLAAACRCSVSAIAKALAELESWGFLSRTPRYRDDGSQTSTLYELGAGRPLGEGVDTGTPPPVRVDTPGVDVGTHQEGEPLEGEQPPQPPASGGREPRRELDGELIGVADVGGVVQTGNMSKPVATPSRRQREVSDDDPDWSAFWAAYPRKVSKGAARKAWTRALGKVESAAVLIRGAEQVAADLAYRKRNPRPDDRGRDVTSFVPYPATWLNREQWMDQDPAGKKQDDGRLRPPKKDEECPIHVGQWASNCRGCAADQKAKPDPD